ncbi:AAA family ATPase [Mycobacterium yunnanensis]|uniref:AAA family ATPase n=1 Tax=Mycobacterium yunnanensis TaxID=368477 RepID=A0A9X2Z4J2_9MYCO|nr:ATP-binding protein [Mycobacterium yunnanensis]MCV7421727.1 AAA family ATPase [Mycobacterium yunnanensis]
MLVWINGAFGAGKTHTAHELHRRLDGSRVSDPELLGFALQKMLPAAARGDFQDLPQWRTAGAATLRDADAASGGPVIVPMTLVRDDYFDEIIGGLRADGVDVRHYALLASPETLRRRLRARLAYVGGRLVGRDETWAMRQIDRCVAALSDARYATHVPTDDRSVDEVVETIAADAQLELTRGRLSPVRFQIRRLGVAVRHIRL